MVQFCSAPLAHYYSALDREATVNDYALFFRAFSDLHRTIEDIIAEGDKVFLRTTAEGTHRDMIPGISTNPTGKNITWTVWEVFRFTDGKMVERWAIHDGKDRIEEAARE